MCRLHGPTLRWSGPNLGMNYLLLKDTIESTEEVHDVWRSVSIMPTLCHQMNYRWKCHLHFTGKRMHLHPYRITGSFECVKCVDDRDPCLAFYEDLRGEVLTWLAAGDQIIIGGDLNAHVLKPTVSLFFSQLGLHNLIFERHSPIGAPTTSAQNEQRKILDSFWGTANILVARCGYCHPKAFPLGGHSVVWIDLTYSCALGHYPPDSPHFPSP